MLVCSRGAVVGVCFPGLYPLSVTCHGCGKLVQVASGASGLSRQRGVQDMKGIGWGKGILCHGPVHGMVQLVAGVRWVRCRRWDCCWGSSKSMMPVVG